MDLLLSRKRQALSHPDDATGSYLPLLGEVDVLGAYDACGSGDSFGNFLATALGIPVAQAGPASVATPDMSAGGVSVPERATSSSTESGEQGSLTCWAPGDALRCVDETHAPGCKRRASLSPP